MIVKRKTSISIKHETTRQKENKSQTKRNRGIMMARVRVLYTYATSRHCSDLLSVLDCRDKSTLAGCKRNGGARGYSADERIYSIEGTGHPDFVAE